MMKHLLADRMQHIQPFHVMDILAQAKKLESQGRTIIHMEVGEPDFNTPKPVLTAANKAIQEGKIHYTPACGLPQLREKIAQYYAERFQTITDPSNIIITPGASGALQLILGILINPDDEVLITDPGYPCNANFIHLFQGKPVRLNVDDKTCYQPTADSIKKQITPKTKAIILASPSNPTGTLISKDQLKAIIEVTDSTGIYLIIDEIYQGLTYENKDYSALELSNKIFIINSFSKYFGMTGFRLGWLVAPDEFTQAIDHLAQNIFLAPPTISQYAALEAFSKDTMQILETRRHTFQHRRDYLYNALKESGFRIPNKPGGAFYIYANCQNFTNDSFQFCKNLLNETGVAITPGIDFGSNKPEKHVRFAYTTSSDKLEHGISLIHDYLKKRT